MSHRSVEEQTGHHGSSWWVIGACVSILALAVGGLIGALGQ